MQGVLIELPLAGFFLKKMRNPHSDVNDLVTLDPELYRNLMFMRDYHGDFADLALTFTTADSDITHTREVGTCCCCCCRLTVTQQAPVLLYETNPCILLLLWLLAGCASSLPQVIAGVSTVSSWVSCNLQPAFLTAAANSCPSCRFSASDTAIRNCQLYNYPACGEQLPNPPRGMGVHA